MRRTLVERFSDKFITEPNTGCWIWLGMLDKAGYGRIRCENGRAGESLYAHRVSYELAKGHIAIGLEIDHLCRNRWCVNPLHLEAVTHLVNLVRAFNPKTCKKGHPKNEQNTYWRKDRPGKWNCRECRRELRAKSNRENDARMG